MDTPNKLLFRTICLQDKDCGQLLQGMVTHIDIDIFNIKGFFVWPWSWHSWFLNLSTVTVLVYTVLHLSRPAPAKCFFLIFHVIRLYFWFAGGVLIAEIFNRNVIMHLLKSCIFLGFFYL